MKMKSTLLVPPGAAGQQDAAPAATGTCRYPGCGHPARARAGDGPGAPPRYCGRTVAEDHGEHGTAEVTHTALTAFRRRQELAGADATPAREAAKAARAEADARAAAADDDRAATLQQAGQVRADAAGQVAQAQAEAQAAVTAARAGRDTALAAAAAASARDQAARDQLAQLRDDHAPHAAALAAARHAQLRPLEETITPLRPPLPRTPADPGAR